MTAAKTLRTLLAGNRALIAPAVFNPLSAKLAEGAGFEVLYLGGGTVGYLNCCLEANLNITQLCQAGIDIRAVCNLPLILDGAAGFGDPMHMHHTIGMAEAAGFAAIEIEDQILNEIPFIRVENLGRKISPINDMKYPCQSNQVAKVFVTNPKPMKVATNNKEIILQLIAP